MRYGISGASALAWLVLASCAVLHPLLSQSAAAAQPSLGREFQAAMAAQQRGDLDTAKAILLRISREHQGLFPVDESLGLIDAAQGKFVEALPSLRAAVREQPASDAAYANLGAALYRLHRNIEALNAFERAAQLNPDNPSTQQSLAAVLLEEGQPRAAADAFRRALESKKGDAHLALQYASALMAAGDLGEARRVVSTLPDADRSAEAQVLFAEIEEKGGDFRSAAEHFNYATQLDPSEANIWALGTEFLQHWSFDAAISEFETGLARYPSSTRMKTGLAVAYFGDAKYGEAISAFANLLRGDRNNSLYAEMLGMACTAASNAERTDCSALVAYAQAHPRDGRAATYAATQLLTQSANDSRAALGKKLLKQALATDPKLPEAQLLMGQVKQSDGDWPGSIPYLQRAITLKPSLAQAHYRLALAYWRTGHKQEAKREMNLQKKYAQQQREDLDHRLRQITTFIVKVPQ